MLLAGRYDAAYYLAGYAIECVLKACIARKTKRHDFPERDNRNLYTHDLQALAREAGIDAAFAVERSKDRTLEAYWAVVKEWTPEERYVLRSPRAAREKAKEMVAAIGDDRHGVMQCLCKYW